MAPTVREVARHAGVSSGTVSRVLNNRPNVDRELQRRVTAAARELGYSLKPSGRARTGAVKLEIGFLLALPEVEESMRAPSPFWVNIFDGAEQHARQGGRRITYRVLHHLEAAPESIGEQVADLSLDAALLVGSAPEPAIAALAELGLPTVLVDNVSTETRLPAVLSDNFGGASAAMEHLLGLGHREVAFIGGPERERAHLDAIYSIYWRFLGYRAALEKAGIEYRSSLVAHCDLTAVGGAKAVRELLRRDRFTAVFCANDPTASGVLRALYEEGIDVPGQLSVVGFDDDLRFHTVPSLTTLRVDKEAMGAMAVQSLVDFMERPHLPPVTVVTPVDLLVRESSGPRSA